MTQSAPTSSITMRCVPEDHRVSGTDGIVGWDSGPDMHLTELGVIMIIMIIIRTIMIIMPKSKEKRVFSMFGERRGREIFM